MELRSSRILFIINIFILMLPSLAGCSIRNNRQVMILAGFDYDSTYRIADTRSNKIIYDGGHNKIQLDTIIGGNYVFIEDLITEECSDRIIVYNPQKKILLRAYNLGWCFNFQKEEKDQLLSGIDKPYVIDNLSLKYKQVTIRFFNDSTAFLQLEDDLMSD